MKNIGNYKRIRKKLGGTISSWTNIQSTVELYNTTLRKRNKDKVKPEEIKKECKIITELPKKKKPKQAKRKTDMFQQLFDTITNITQEL